MKQVNLFMHLLVFLSRRIVEQSMAEENRCGVALWRVRHFEVRLSEDAKEGSIGPLNVSVTVKKCPCDGTRRNDRVSLMPKRRTVGPLFAGRTCWPRNNATLMLKRNHRSRGLSLCHIMSSVVALIVSK